MSITSRAADDIRILLEAVFDTGHRERFPGRAESRLRGAAVRLNVLAAAKTGVRLEDLEHAPLRVKL